MMGVTNLRELAALMVSMAEKIENIKEVKTPEQFLELQNKINTLQVEAPGRLAAKARAAWLNHGLDSYEKTVVAATEQKTPGWEQPEHSFPGFLTHFGTFIFFLNRHYLGSHFRAIHERLEKILQRLVKATRRTRQENHWQDQMKRHRNLLF